MKDHNVGLSGKGPLNEQTSRKTIESCSATPTTFENQYIVLGTETRALLSNVEHRQANAVPARCISHVHAVHILMRCNWYSQTATTRTMLTHVTQDHSLGVDLSPHLGGHRRGSGDESPQRGPGVEPVESGVWG